MASSIWDGEHPVSVETNDQLLLTHRCFNSVMVLLQVLYRYKPSSCLPLDPGVAPGHPRVALAPDPGLVHVHLARGAVATNPGVPLLRELPLLPCALYKRLL